MYSYKIKTLFIIGVLAIAACTSAEDEKKKLIHYNLEAPEKFFMPESLLEVSGIAFNNGNADTIYSIQDEEGRVFRQAWGNKKQYHTKFGKKGDYEDVSVLDSMVYVLKSNGTIYGFPLADAVYEEIDSTNEWKSLLPKGEYEGMYGDAATKKLYVICKNCEDDNNKNTVSGYILQTGDSMYASGNFKVDVKEIKAINGKVKRGFRPSALAKNPVTNEWYILSAVNELLIVTDSNWQIKEVVPLNSNMFNQPEGIAFDKTGNLYISNEGGDLSEGNILKFVRK